MSLDSQEQRQLLTAARGQSVKYGWSPGLLGLVEAAIINADPWGPNSLASGPRWWAAIMEQLIELQDNLPSEDAARVAKLIDVARVGASGAERPGVVEMAGDFIKGATDDVRTAAAKVGEAPAELAEAAKGPGGLAFLLLVLAGGAAWLRRRS